MCGREGMHGGRACVARGVHDRGGVCGMGYACQGFICGKGSMHIRGACVAGGMHGGVHAW